MSKDAIGRAILAATSKPPCCTAEQADLLARRVLLLEPWASACEAIRELMGFVQNSSETTVRLSQDDATRSFLVAVGDSNPRTYFGDSLFEAVEAAKKGEQGLTRGSATSKGAQL